MSCKDLMIADMVTVTAETPVRAALDSLLAHRIRAMPVVDAGGKYLGFFSLHGLLKTLIPLSATMQGGFAHLDFMADDRGAILQKFRDVGLRKVGEAMATDVPAVGPEEVLEEVLLQLWRHNSPLPVVDPVTGRLLGLFTEQSAILALMKGA